MNNMNELAMKAKEDMEAREELFEMNMVLIKKLIKKKGWFVEGCEQDDLFQFGFIGFLKAVQSYDITRGDWKSHMLQNVKTAIFAEMNKTKQKNKRANYGTTSLNFETEEGTEVIEFFAENSKTPEEQLLLKEEVQFVEKEMNKMKDESKQILKLHLDGFSYEEIQEELNIEKKKRVDNVLFHFKKRTRERKELVFDI